MVNAEAVDLSGQGSNLNMGGGACALMNKDRKTLNEIGRMYEEAARTHGDDPLKIVNHVNAMIEALSPADRLAVRADFERMASPVVTGPTRRKTHH
jgi:hypothetical protein